MQIRTLYNPGQLSISGLKTTNFEPFFWPFLIKTKDFFLINILFYTCIFTLNHPKRYKSAKSDENQAQTDPDLASQRPP